jgi:hypothetical protein
MMNLCEGGEEIEKRRNTQQKKKNAIAPKSKTKIYCTVLICRKYTTVDTTL